MQAQEQALYKCLNILAEFIPENILWCTLGHTMAMQILFLIAGSSILVVSIFISAYFCAWKKRSRSSSSKVEESKDSFTFKLKEDTCQEIPIKEIYSATNNLSHLNFIGQGIAGKVYKGVLSNGWHVAIKHILKDAHMETFVREVTSLSHVRHRNLVTLRGYCEGEDECFLVYELCTQGNLSEWLFGKERFLSWEQRLEIAVGSARGLWFLHSYSGGCIVHRDIKPTNILIGLDFEAKLSDFGLSKVIDIGFSSMSSEVRGTIGYVDPEYRRGRHVNAAGDVYSFGIVLLQLLSGKKAINLNYDEALSLNKLAKLIVRSGNMAEFADPRMGAGGYSKEAFEAVLKLALSCTSRKNQRPSMQQVVSRLEAALEVSARESCSHHRRSSVFSSNHSITVGD